MHLAQKKTGKPAGRASDGEVLSGDGIRIADIAAVETTARSRLAVSVGERLVRVEMKVHDQ
jgi:hypothetical protein